MGERGEDGSGRDYLEKIIQLPFDLPAPPRHLLRGQLDDGLESSVAAAMGAGAVFDEGRWPDIRLRVIDPLIRNMRDVHRFLATSRGTIVMLGGDVELGDVLALEAIRVFLPGDFARVHELIDALTYPASSRRAERLALHVGVDGTPPLKSELGDWANKASGSKAVVNAMIHLLFPYGAGLLDTDGRGPPRWPEAADTGLGDRRVCNEPVLRRYLEGTRGYDLMVADEAEAWLNAMHDAVALDQRLDNLEAGRAGDILLALLERTDRLTLSHEPGVVVLLNRLKDFGAGLSPSGAPTISPRQAVLRIVRRLIDLADDHANVYLMLRDMLPRLQTLGSKTALVQLVGHRSSVGGERLIEPDDAARLERVVAADIARAFERAEIDLSDFAWVVSFATRVGFPVTLTDCPTLTFRVLHSVTYGAGMLPGGELDSGFLDLLYGDPRCTARCLERFVEEWETVLPLATAEGLGPPEVERALNFAKRFLARREPAEV